MKEVTCYKSKDGKLHENLRSCLWDDAERKLHIRAQRAMDRGADLLTVLRILNAGHCYHSSAARVLSQLTRYSKLTIEHWQCSKRPGYQPTRVTRFGDFFVGGDVGAWTGSYGANVGVMDLVRYAEQTPGLTQPQAPSASEKER